MGGTSDAVSGGEADRLNLRVLLVGGAKGGAVQGKRHANDAAVWSSSVRMNMAVAGGSVSKTQSLRSKLQFTVSHVGSRSENIKSLFHPCGRFVFMPPPSRQRRGDETSSPSCSSATEKASVGSFGRNS